ncbi:MAG: DNA glycosylase AlkZ-like family protein [Chloroflexota bacterium]
MPLGSTPPGAPLVLDHDAVLRGRIITNGLAARLPRDPEALRAAAWAGLQDSMPRAALLSLHARVAGIEADALDDPALVQVWGPHHAAYVVAAADLAPFTLGRLPDGTAQRRRAVETAERLVDFLGVRELGYGAAGRGIGLPPNALRYAAPTGRILLRWDGARQPTIRVGPPLATDPEAARLELARRHLHVYGPTTADAFGRWSSVGPAAARRTWAALGDALVPVRTPAGAGTILAADEAAFRASPDDRVPGVRLLPSGDALTLLHSAERELIVPDAAARAELWTSRVWPGALLLDGRIVGAWRPADADLTVVPWRALSGAERSAIEAEAASLPLAVSGGALRVRWAGPGDRDGGRSGA